MDDGRRTTMMIMMVVVVVMMMTMMMMIVLIPVNLYILLHSHIYFIYVILYTHGKSKSF